MSEPNWERAVALLSRLVKAQDDLLVCYRIGSYGPRGANAADRVRTAREAWERWREKNVPSAGEDTPS